MTNIFQILKLTRFFNLVIIAITQLMTALFLTESTTFTSVIGNYQLLILIISTLFIAAAGYLINDYYDIKIDNINKPNHIIIGKYITPKQVIIICSIFNFIGVVLGAFISWWIMGLNALVAFLLWFYATQLKRLPLWGNLAIGFLTGLSVFIIYLYYYKNLENILVYTIFAFFISLIREIIKDIEDIKGDKKFGCKTLPIFIGIKKTKKIIYFIVFIFSTVIFYITHNWQIFLPFSIALTGILGFFCLKLFYADKKRDYSNLSSLSKIIMIMGIGSMMII